ncbi:hypothetical protein [Nocardia sp. NPDC005366]|uniref:hypothetical protein n=1 Tax=Nocardia sp. NPDC005366 TaxID=3156878 RepID=UPI0033A3136E
MTGSDARTAFFTELDQLRSAANKGRRPLPVKEIAEGTGIAVTTLYGWFPADASKKRTVTRKDDQLMAVIVFLMRKAGILAAQQGLDRRAWQDWRDRRDAAVAADAPVGVRSFYKAKVREGLAPLSGLRQRETELAMLADFCAGTARYLWIRADPWAGKSALLSTFLLDPPPEVTTIGFFVTARANENTHQVFTDTVLDQLRVLLPDELDTIVSERVSRDGLRAEMLSTAAEREAAAGRRLVLVVDGLDEYTDTDRIPITDLLPARPHDNLQVIVASRYGPEILVPAHHPLAGAIRYELTKSQFAAGLEQLAHTELKALLEENPAHRDLVALITVAKGLTGHEIGELTGLAPFEIDPLLRERASRSFRTTLVPASLDGTEELAYVLAHDTLQDIAEHQLGHQLDTALQRLHVWADRYRHQGWPAHTPDFLLRRYFPVLDQHEDLTRTTALAMDTIRHDRIRARTGGDLIALDEIRTVQQRICAQPVPDLLTTARLARYRARLHQANNKIPTTLPAVWAELGRPERAEALARTLPDPVHQAQALRGVAVAVAATDPDRAEALAITITYPRDQAEALRGVAVAVAQSDPDRAEALARTLTSPRQQAQALSGIASAIAKTDPDRAGRLADRAEALARAITDTWVHDRVLSGVVAAVAQTDPDRAEALAITITDPDRHAEALGGVAVAVAQTDPDRVGRLADRVEALARTLTTWPQQAQALRGIVAAVAATDPGRAEALARTITITDPDRHAEALGAVVAAIAQTDPDRAGRLADRVEAFAVTLTYPEHRAQALAGIATAVAQTDAHRAGRLADRAEALARTITDTWEYDRALNKVVAAVAATDPDRAEALTQTITDKWQQDWALRAVAVAIAETDPDRAEALTRTITDRSRQAEALRAVAVAIAETDPDRAEALARTFADPRQQAWALEQVMAAVAQTAPDPGRAEALSCNTDPQQHDRALDEVVAAIAETDPDRAEALARTITDPWQHDRAISRIAAAVAKIDPDRAEALARTITDPRQQAEVLGEAIAVIAQTDPDQVQSSDPAAHNLTRRPAANSLHSRGRGLLALAWSVLSWEIPVQALPAVDPTVLQALVDDLLIES